MEGSIAKMPQLNIYLCLFKNAGHHGPGVLVLQSQSSLKKKSVRSIASNPSLLLLWRQQALSCCKQGSALDPSMPSRCPKVHTHLLSGNPQLCPHKSSYVWHSVICCPNTAVPILQTNMLVAFTARQPSPALCLLAFLQDRWVLRGQATLEASKKLFPLCLISSVRSRLGC